MPIRRRSAVTRSSRLIDGSLRSTSRRAESHSSCGSTSATAAAATSPSTPLARSSDANARRASPRPDCREDTHAAAKAASSIRPTSANRSRTAAAASSGTPFLASRSASCLRVLAAPVSARRQMPRATVSGSPISSSGAPGTSSAARELHCGPLARPPWPRRPARLPAPPRAVARPERRPDRRASSSAGPASGSEPPPATPPNSVSDTGGSEVGRLDSRGLVQRRPDAELLLDLLLDLVGEVGVVPQEVARVLLALAELVALVGVPGTGLAHEALLHTHVDEATLATEALTPDQVELGLLERRRDLVLHDLDPHPAADRVGALLQGLDPAHVQTHRGVELQRTATGGDLRRAVDDADLLPQLVDEDGGRAGVAQRTGDLAQ